MNLEQQKKQARELLRAIEYDITQLGGLGPLRRVSSRRACGASELSG